MQQWQLEQYRIVRCLTQPAGTATGMSPQVWLILRPESSQHSADALALKFLPAIAAEDQQRLFNNEISVLKGLYNQQSVYLMQYIAHGELAGDHPLLQHAGRYVLMPFYAGGSLRDYLQQHTLSQQQVFALFEQMLQAVAALHTAGFLHLDIKPANFLFKQAGDTGLVLADFALAQAIDTPQQYQVTVQGTPKYMSPEQFLGQPLSRQTDFYALGIMLYEMLAGQPPFNAGIYQQWAVQHCQQAVPLLAEPLQAWQPLLDGLLAKNRQLRFNTIDAIQRCLHSIAVN